MVRPSRQALAVLAALLACAGGCAQAVEPQGAGAPLHAPCGRDLDCAPGLSCLLWRGIGGGQNPRTICTVPCTSTAECPPVRSEHCGDQTICAGGVCGYRPCL